MNDNARQLTRQALSLIETARYRMGVSRFIAVFIDHWAYQQTGLYSPTEAFSDDLGAVASKLSHLLSSAMKADPTSDILGYILSESGFYKQGTQFYPTPPEVARLMAQINLADAPRPDAEFYEPCCGTGINTIHCLKGFWRPEALPGSSQPACTWKTWTASWSRAVCFSFSITSTLAASLRLP